MADDTLPPDEWDQEPPYELPFGLAAPRAAAPIEEPADAAAAALVRAQEATSEDDPGSARYGSAEEHDPGPAPFLDEEGSGEPQRRPLSRVERAVMRRPRGPAGGPEPTPAASPMGRGPDGNPVLPPVYWPGLRVEQRMEQTHELWRWVEQLQRRFPEMTTLPKCWPAHNSFVEVLSALRDAERVYYSQRPPAVAPANGSYNWLVVLWQIDAKLAEWKKNLACGGELSTLTDPSMRHAHPHESPVDEMPVEVRNWLGSWAAINSVHEADAGESA